ncbi:hypothetical protein ACHAQI_009544 [Fusarium lateritium]
MSSTNAPAVPGNPSSRSDKPFLLPNPRAAKNADQQTWFPAEYRSHPTRFDADTLSKIVRITQLAVNHHVPLASLWAPGGALARSVSGVPPKLTRKEAGFALERLREDIQAANPLQTIVQQHVDDLGDDDPDSGFFDVGGSDDEDPDDTQGETSIAKTTSLAHKILPQLKYNVCLTDDVLQFLTTVIHSHSESDSHLMDALWFSVKKPPQPPSFLTEPTAMFFPMHLNSHWILVHVNPQAHAQVTVYDSLPTAERTSSVTKALAEWFSEHLPAWRARVSFQPCAKQSDSTSCGIFVVTFLERLLRGHSTSHAINPTAERAQLLRAISHCDSSRFSGLGDIGITIQQVQGLIRTDPITARIVDTAMASQRIVPLSLPPTNLQDSGSNVPAPASTTPAPGSETSTSAPKPSAETKAKRKNSDASDLPSKRQIIDINDIGGLSALLQNALAEKQRAEKHAKVRKSTALLNSASDDLASAKARLDAANLALQQGTETSQRSAINASAFSAWIASAPTTSSDELFASTVKKTQDSMGAFLDQYNFTVEKSLSRLKPDAAAAEKVVEHHNSVVDDRKQDLEMAQEENETSQDLEELGSLLGRLAG